MTSGWGMGGGGGGGRRNCVENLRGCACSVLCIPTTDIDFFYWFFLFVFKFYCNDSTLNIIANCSPHLFIFCHCCNVSSFIDVCLSNPPPPPPPPPPFPQIVYVCVGLCVCERVHYRVCPGRFCANANHSLGQPSFARLASTKCARMQVVIG